MPPEADQRDPTAANETARSRVCCLQTAFQCRRRPHAEEYRSPNAERYSPALDTSCTCCLFTWQSMGGSQRSHSKAMYRPTASWARGMCMRGQDVPAAAESMCIRGEPEGGCRMHDLRTSWPCIGARCAVQRPSGMDTCKVYLSAQRSLGIGGCLIRVPAVGLQGQQRYALHLQQGVGERCSANRW